MYRAKYDGRVIEIHATTGAELKRWILTNDINCLLFESDLVDEQGRQYPAPIQFGAGNIVLPAELVDEKG